MELGELLAIDRGEIVEIVTHVRISLCVDPFAAAEEVYIRRCGKCDLYGSRRKRMYEREFVGGDAFAALKLAFGIGSVCLSRIAGVV